ncbi:MAG: DUF167 domain-containing protein [Acidimicrobiales bacterium]|nr:DUF167 domain-containing protein [Acidimicrobiales bacterium]
MDIVVRPNALRNRVGGSHDGALVVRVADPADRGRATRAALRAVADSFGVPVRCITLVRGPTSRRKVVEIATACRQPEQLQNRLRQLLQDGP